MTPRLRATLSAAGLALGLVLVILGFSAVPLCVFAVLPWLWILAVRLGASLGIISSLFAAILLLMAVQFATTPSGLPLLPTAIAIFTALGGLGIFLQVRWPSPRVPRVTRESSAWAWVAGLPGAAVWGATLLLATVVPGAASGWGREPIQCR